MSRQILFILLLSVTFLSVGWAQQVEQNTDRPGQNYRNFDLDAPEPERCRAACMEDGNCRAWTYVKPGFQGPQARCWLKSGVPPAKSNTCCVSGVKAAGQAQAPNQTPQRVKVAPELLKHMQTDTSTQEPTVATQNLVPRVKIPPDLARRPSTVLSRGALINRILSTPRTASRFNQVAGTLGIPAQQLATQSTSGKTIAGGWPIVNPASLASNLDWESGVRFTPRSDKVFWQISGIMMNQDTQLEAEMNFGLTDMFQRDELFLYGNPDELGIVLDVDMPPGKYVITVELAMNLNPSEGLKFSCSNCTNAWYKLDPIVDQKAIAEGISLYIGTFNVPSYVGVGLVIQLPGATVAPLAMGIFRGITLTRL